MSEYPDPVDDGTNEWANSVIPSTNSPAEVKVEATDATVEEQTETKVEEKVEPMVEEANVGDVTTQLASATIKPETSKHDEDGNIQHAVKELFDSKLVDVTNVDLNVVQADESSPLFSAILFEDVGKQPDVLPIKKEVLQAAYEMGYRKPSKIQATALPLLLKNKNGEMENMIFQSQAGTGKTAAFAMNVLTRCNDRIKSCQALYIAPTFHLVFQTHHVFEALGHNTNLTVGVLFGVGKRDRDGNTEIMTSVKNIALNTTPCDDQIVCATLDKVLNVVKHGGSIKNGRKNVDLFNPEAIEMLVIDEADDFLFNKDNIQKLRDLVSHLSGLKQTIMLSATFKDETIAFANQIAPNANIIKLPMTEVVKENVQQFFMNTPSVDHKIDSLLSIYNSLDIEQAIVFCNEIQMANELVEIFKSKGHTVCLLVGRNMTKEEQLQQLDSFIKKESKILFTTNILARGIDIEQMSLVVNFDVPTRPNPETGYFEVDPEAYVHRIGRCGRFGHKGTAVSFVESTFDYTMLKEIQNLYKFSVKEIETHLDLQDEVMAAKKSRRKAKFNKKKEGAKEQGQDSTSS
eukprot:m.6076 g.6076  ORF g.6076 m.6076 type:complete len:574 (+) comp2541_c0_seq1:36-1757(+)